MTAYLAPQFDTQFFDGSTVAAGYKLYTYDSGTTTPKATYTDQAGGTPNTNPIILDSAGRCNLWLGTGEYTFVLKTAADSTVKTWNDVGGASTTVDDAAIRADLASTSDASKGAGMVGWVQSGVGTIARWVLDKLREDKSLNDFAGANDDQRFNNAKANGTKWLRIPQGDHTISGWSIAASDSLVGLIFEPGARLLVTASSGVIGLDIQADRFKIIGECWIESTGTTNDALATIGVRHGHPSLGGKAFFEAERIRYANFSGRGFVSYAPVYIGIDSIVGTGGTLGNSLYGFSIEKSGSTAGTTIQLRRSYITGALRGINIDSAGWVELNMPVLEYCGSGASNDGALHLNNVATCLVTNIYGEQNYRNIARVDSTPTFISGSMFTATAAADYVTYSGVPFNQRGVVQIRGNTINARAISYDINDNADLAIGTNLTVPAAGGSVIFGNETMTSETGTLTNATWTTVHTFTANEMSGTNAVKAFFEYVCYAGVADLSTGFDAGTIFGGTARSYTGALPAWLRMSGNTLQMNVTSSSYGLNYKVILRKVFPG